MLVLGQGSDGGRKRLVVSGHKYQEDVVLALGNEGNSYGKTCLSSKRIMTGIF